jgi:curved DNA-binding protein CbpA
MPDLSKTTKLTYYQLLDLTPSAKFSESEIKKKFRAAALKLHPDKSLLSENTDTDSMRLLIQARDTLINPDKREIYDKELLGNAEFVIPITENCHPEHYRLKQLHLSKMITQSQMVISQYGYHSDQAAQMHRILSTVRIAFTAEGDHSYRMIALTAKYLIEPLRAQIKILHGANDNLSKVKIGQLETLLEEIDSGIIDGIFKGIRRYERFVQNPLDNTEIKKYEYTFSKCGSAHGIYCNLHQLINTYANKKEINSHRNLIADFLKGLVGVFIILMTVIPTVGAVLLSETYRRKVNHTFFATKSRAHLEEAVHKFYTLR